MTAVRVSLICPVKEEVRRSGRSVEGSKKAAGYWQGWSESGLKGSLTKHQPVWTHSLRARAGVSERLESVAGGAPGRQKKIAADARIRPLKSAARRDLHKMMPPKARLLNDSITPLRGKAGTSASFRWVGRICMEEAASTPYGLGELVAQLAGLGDELRIFRGRLGQGHVQEKQAFLAAPGRSGHQS